MKHLLLALITAISACQPVLAESEYAKEERVIKDFAQSLQPGDCYRAEQSRMAQHTFENSYIFVDQVHFVIARDKTGLLIAQPHPECKQPSDQSAKCTYWFRSMEFSSPFLMCPGVRKVKCPAGITMKLMIQRLKKSPEAHEFKVDQL